jgi:hypothetical protein
VLTLCSLFCQALHLTWTRISEKSTEVQQHSFAVELEEANAQLRVELAAAHTKVAEVECHEQALTSDYDGLCPDFNDLQTSHSVVVKEKESMEKTECEKAQRF